MCNNNFCLVHVGPIKYSNGVFLFNHIKYVNLDIIITYDLGRVEKSKGTLTRGVLLKSIYPFSLTTMCQFSHQEFKPRWGECKTYFPTILVITTRVCNMLLVICIISMGMYVAWRDKIVLI